MTKNIVPFPAQRQIGKIRRTASIYVDKAEGNDCRWSDGYWRQVTGHMARHMETFGLDGKTIDRELTAFRDAVISEVSRLRAVSSQPTIIDRQLCVFRSASRPE